MNNELKTNRNNASINRNMSEDVDEMKDVDEDNDEEGNDDEKLIECELPPGVVRLRPSQFHGLPATVFFEYPHEIGSQRLDESIYEPLGTRKLLYTNYWERICVRNAFQSAGFIKKVDSDANNTKWTAAWSKHFNQSQLKELNCLQKVNHFPNSWSIGRKDRLIRTLNQMRRIHNYHYDFHPESFILPSERDALHRQIKIDQLSARSNTSNLSSPFISILPHENDHTLWIFKPVASSCGRGIKVMTNQQILQVPSKKVAIIQRYLLKPYLINGHKFDLRIYVLVTGVDPLRVYIHDEGLTRISTTKYSLKNIRNRFAHLTNYSINKKSNKFKAADSIDGSMKLPKVKTKSEDDGAEDDKEDEEGDEIGNGTGVGGGEAPKGLEDYKWSLTAFRQWLAEKEGRDRMEETFDKIFHLCLKTMIAAESEITPSLHQSLNYRTNCYEFFGCDVILDNKLNPYLIEVNISPSLMGSSPLDKQIKGIVMSDVFHTIGFYPHDTNLLKSYNDGDGGGSGGGETMESSSKKIIESNTSSKSNRSDGSRHESASSSSLMGTQHRNPFLFSSLSTLLQSQDAYRKCPSPGTIDLDTLFTLDNNTEPYSCWVLLLMIEDEILRAKSTRFHLVHPTPTHAEFYTTIYRNCRFSDHLLARWVMSLGSKGPFLKYIPDLYLKEEHLKLKKNFITKKNAVKREIRKGKESVLSTEKGKSSPFDVLEQISSLKMKPFASIKTPRVRSHSARRLLEIPSPSLPHTEIEKLQLSELSEQERGINSSNKALSCRLNGTVMTKPNPLESHKSETFYYTNSSLDRMGMNPGSGLKAFQQGLDERMMGYTRGMAGSPLSCSDPYELVDEEIQLDHSLQSLHLNQALAPRIPPRPNRLNAVMNSNGSSFLPQNLVVNPRKIIVNGQKK